MAKKIQISVILFACCTWFVSHHSAFAILSSTDPVQQSMQQNDFLGKNTQSILHFGIKSWVQGTKKIIEQHWAIGSEIAIGPVVAWRPFNGLGLQTGLLYSYNSFFTVDFSVDRKKFSDRNLFAFGRRVINEINVLAGKNEGYIAHAALGHIQFHAISLPLFFRLYPEKSRKWVCYGGPRLILMLPGLDKKQYFPVHIDTSVIKNIFYDGLKKGNDINRQSRATIQDLEYIAQQGLLQICRSIFNLKADASQNQPFNNKNFNWDLVWDFGIEFRGNAGLVIGINGLGLVLGYDYVK